MSRHLTVNDSEDVRSLSGLEPGDIAVLAANESGIANNAITAIITDDYKMTIYSPEDGATIPESAFSDRYDVIGLALGNNITSIGSLAFGTCENLKGALIIPPSVKRVSYGAFYDCFSVDELILQEGLEIIESYAFYAMNAVAGYFHIPETVKRIDGQAFSGLGYNIPYTSPGKLTGDLVIPSSVESIGQEAFQLAGLHNDIIIKGSTQISKWVFRYCPLVRDIYCEMDRSLWMPSSLLDCGSASTRLCVKSQYFSQYSNMTDTEFVGTVHEWTSYPNPLPVQ